MPDRTQTFDLPQRCRYTWHSPEALQGQTPPVCRCKHATYVDDGILYVHGGRNGGVCYREMWKCYLEEGRWEKVICSGDQPLSPQEHTIVAHKNKLYVFGGQFCCSSDKEPPLWALDLDLMVWSKQYVHGNGVTPGGRRGHTAAIYQDMMCIYGGYVDLKGSSNEVWIYDLKEEVWHLMNSASVYEFGPDGRHSHSAVVNDGAMWIYGGMSDLQPKDDLWRWDFICSQWNRIKVRPCPPPLKGHSACCVQGQMLVFGGASQGTLSSSLWCFHFGTTAWTKLVPLGPTPPVCIYHCSVALEGCKPNGKDGYRSQSYPQLQKKSSRNSTERTYSSPAVSGNSADNPVIFRNKIGPSDKPKSLAINVASKSGKVEESPIEPDPQLTNAVQEYSNSTSPESISPTSTVARQLWCRSTSCILCDGNSEDIPLVEMQRRHSVDSVSLNSADYMDTVAGSYVNRILTAVHNLRRPMYKPVPMMVDDSPASYKRQKSTDGVLDHNRNMSRRRKVKHPHPPEPGQQSDHLREVSEAVGGPPQSANNVKTHLGKGSDADDLQLIDMDEYDEDYFNDLKMDGHGINASNVSETACLLGHRSEIRSGTQQRSRADRNIRSVVRCFSNRYTLLANSSDSLPYGAVNPLCNTTPPSTGKAVGGVEPRRRLETGQIEDPRLLTAPHNPQLLPANKLSKDSRKLGVNRTTQDTDDAPRTRKPRSVCPPPSYDSLDSPASDPPTYNENADVDTVRLLPDSNNPSTMTIDLSDVSSQRNLSPRSDKVITAWHPASPTLATEMDIVEKSANGASKSEHQVLGATGGEPPSYGHKMHDGPAAESQEENRPQNYVMYVVGGQTTEVTRFGSKPLLMLKLSIATGVR